MSATATQPTFTLITGGNSGIGLELARQAAADGRNLILVAQNPAALETAAAELNRNVKVHTISHDLSQPGAAEVVYDSVRKLGADVDCLINNAGFGDHGPFATSDLARQRSMIAVNITALTELTRLFLPAMLQRGRGQILNVASVTAFVPGPLMSVYFATKHYVLAFSEALIEELRGSGVTVTALCPPPVRTPFASAAQIAVGELHGHHEDHAGRGGPVRLPDDEARKAGRRLQPEMEIRDVVSREDYAALWLYVGCSAA